jgi:hypothetical protein
MTAIIPYLIIAGIGAGGFFWIKGLIKKNKALKKENKYLDQRIDFYQKNRQAYQAVLDKIMKGKKHANEIKETINNSDGSDLADILNEL